MLPGFGSGGRMRTLDSGTPLAGRGVLELAPIGGKMRDQAADQVARAGVRDVAHDGGDIDDGVSLHHAQFVVVEKCQLHGSLPHSVPDTV